MPRALLLGVTIVAAIPLQLSAAAAARVPLPPEVVAIAANAGVDPSRDPTRFIPDLARALYPSNEAKAVTLEWRLPFVADATTPTVPVPLSAEIWGRAVFHRTIPPGRLVAAILSDRRAAWLARGLSGVDDETLTYLAAHLAILTDLYERDAAAFAAFGPNLHIHDDRVVMPGGADAVELWEAVARERVTTPDRFIRALFTEFNGRLAYVMDTVAAADPTAARFALGAWIDDRVWRASRFHALVAACGASFPEWHIEERPFLRPLGDLAILLLRMPLTASGAPTGLVDRAFWAPILRASASVSGAASPASPDAARAGPIDAAWFIEAIGSLDMYARADRADQFAFGLRLGAMMPTAAAGELPPVIEAFPTHRMLLLTLERLGLASVPTYTAAIQRAREIDDLGNARRFWTTAQFQGALALITRMRRSGVVDAAGADTLVRSASAVPIHDGDYAGGFAEWTRTWFARALPEGPTWEARVIAGLAGREHQRNAPHLAWEGQQYRVDLAFAERQRLDLIRAKQGGHTIDLALTLDEASRRLRGSGLTLAEVPGVLETLTRVITESSAALRRPAVTLMPPGVDVPKDGLEWVKDETQNLERAVRSRDLRRAQRVGTSLQPLADMALADAYLSLAYAADLGEPDGAALLAGNVALRHDFGFARRDALSRSRMPWALPRQDFQPGVPWHVTGSLLGLDIALAQLSLRRLSVDRVTAAPKLGSSEREAFAVAVALVESRRLTDHDRDAIGAAIGRGRARVAAVADEASLDVLAAELGFDGWRRRSVAWTLETNHAQLAQEFSLADLLRLGGTTGIDDLDAWGTPGMYSQGCACLRFPGSRDWRILEGRFQHPMLATTMGDLTLAVALRLADLHLPALLTRPVLMVAMQDFIDEFGSAGDGDWSGLSRQAQATPRQRVEDYVAAAAAVDGPLVPDTGDPASNY